MPDTEPQADDAQYEDVHYDLAGNPLPRRAAPPPAAAPPPPTYAAPAHAGMAAPAFAPPPGYVPPPGYGPPQGYVPPPPKSSPTGPVLYAVLGVVFLGVLGLIFGMRAVKPVSVDAPKTYKAYTALDGTFTCDRPGGWVTKESGVQGGARSRVEFESGKALLEVVSDTTGSLMADITSNAFQTKPPVQRLHEHDKQRVVDALPNYEEQEAQAFQSKVGDSRVSEWTAAEGDVHLHGYRVTMLDKDREISVLCASPERNWAVLKPAFQRIIGSVAPGNP